jgi:hypothetical protein
LAREVFVDIALGNRDVACDGQPSVFGYVLPEEPAE